MEELQSWWEVPTIAHFCSLFRAAFNLSDFDIEDLEEALVNDNEEDKSAFLQDLIIRLLSGCYQRRDITSDNLEKYLQDFVQHRWAHEKGKENVLQDCTFEKLPLRLKVEILHCMCDARLDAPDVAEVLKNLESDSLRVEALGIDDNDSTYWYFYGTRLYREDPVPSKAERLEKEKEIARKKREKEKEKKRKRKDRKKRRGKGRPRRNQKVSSSEGESEEEQEDKNGIDAPSPLPSTSWHVACCTEEDWVELAARFEKSKSRSERELHRTITIDFLPEIGRMIAEREKASKRKSTEIVPRRSSQRISIIRKQREEVERIATEAMVEEQKKYFQELEARKLQMEDSERRQLEARMREERLKERQAAKEERAKRAQLRAERAKLISEGHDLPSHLRHSSKHGRHRPNDLMQESQEELYTGMFKVFEAIHIHPNAWPFAQPVNEEYAPGYYSVVKVPMDLSSIEERLQHKKYQTCTEFEDDVTLMLDNCRKYNGIDSEYTKMAEVLRSVFRRAMKRYFPTESSDEDDGPVANGNSDVSSSASSVSSVTKVPPRPVVAKPLELWSQAVKNTSGYNANRISSFTIGGHRYTSRPSMLSNDPQQGRSSLYLMGDPSVSKAAATTSEITTNSPGQQRQPIYAPGVKQKIIVVQRKVQEQPKMITVAPGQGRGNAQITSRSLEAVNKMAVSMPENQRKSFLNFTAMYQASLSGQNTPKTAASSTVSGGRPLLMLSQKTTNTNAVTSTTQPLLVLRGSIPSAAQASSSTAGSGETKVVYTISPSAMTTASLARPSSAIPVKKRAYMGTPSSTATHIVNSSPLQAAANVTRPEVKPATSVRPQESSEAVKRKWMESLENKLGANSPSKMWLPPSNPGTTDSPRTAATAASLGSVVRKGPPPQTPNLRQVELLNSQRKSVIATVPAAVPAGVNGEKRQAMAAEGLAVKFIQTNGGSNASVRVSSSNSVPVANVQPNVNRGITGSNYVQLPRGNLPVAENFVRTMNSVNSQTTAAVMPNSQAAMVARAPIPQPQRPQQQVMIIKQSQPPSSNFIRVPSSSASSTSYVVTSRQQPAGIRQATSNLVMSSAPQPAANPPQQAVRYQFSMPGINPLVNSGTPEGRLMAAVPAMPRQSSQQVRETPTVMFSKPSVSSSPQTAVSSSQVQFVDQSGRRYTRVGQNFVQVQSPPQPQQVFYIQQPGQVILQQQVLTQPYSSGAPVQHLTVGQKNLVTVPTSGQRTFLTNPQTMGQGSTGALPNGTNFHYYSAVPHQPTS